MHYTQDQLSAAFTLVQDKNNWKNPINVKIDPMHPSLNGNLNLLREAIIHFTGSVPTFTCRNNKVLVEADGYYMTIGA